MLFVSFPFLGGVVQSVFAVFTDEAGNLTSVCRGEWSVNPQESLICGENREIFSLKNSTTFRAKGRAEELYPILRVWGVGIFAQKVTKTFWNYYFFGQVKLQGDT